MFGRIKKTFISYRRDDSAWQTEALHGRLVAAFGTRNVFFDVKDIDYGDAFADIIDRRIDACDAVVVVIGPKWLTLAGTDGQPRLHAPRDYVRHEIASALRQGKQVIPVWVGGAPKPGRADLPADIAALDDLNGLPIGDRRIAEGADKLIDTIRGFRAADDVNQRLWHALGRRLGLAVALLMLSAAWIGLFDLLALDTRSASITLWLADVAAPVPASNELQIVVIDEQTERALGKRFTRNPQARRDHAELIRRLAAAGARTVAFDLFVTTPSPDDDAVLVAAIEAARALKTAVVFGVQDIEARQPVMVDTLRRAVTAWAVLCYGERLGYASTVPLASQRPARPAARDGQETGGAGQQAAGPGGTPTPPRSEPIQAEAIGLALAAAHPGQAKIADGVRKVIVSGERGIREFAYSETETVEATRQRCRAGSSGDTVATALYRSAPAAALNSPERRIAYETVLSMPSEALRRRFAGQTVLVGLQMRDADVFATFHGGSSQPRHGLELHADATSALLDGRIVQPLPLWAQFAAMAALGLLGSRVSQWRPSGFAWARRAALLAAVVACIVGAVALCVVGGMLLNLTYPLSALLAGYWLAARVALPQ